MWNCIPTQGRRFKKSPNFYTPPWLAEWLRDFAKRNLDYRPATILDPCIGTGNLVEPWFGFDTHIIGIDIDIDGFKWCDEFCHIKFEDIEHWPCRVPNLVLCNPPFCGGKGQMMYAEVFLRQIVNLFGRVPVLMFVPYTFRMNFSHRSRRLIWLREHVEITTIVSMPSDTFDGVKFHHELLAFNFPSGPSHLFLPDPPRVD